MTEWKQWHEGRPDGSDSAYDLMVFFSGVTATIMFWAGFIMVIQSGG